MLPNFAGLLKCGRILEKQTQIILRAKAAARSNTECAVFPCSPFKCSCAGCKAIPAAPLYSRRQACEYARATCRVPRFRAR